MLISTIELRTIDLHQRHTYDFVIDGVSLAETLEAERFDLVGRLDVGNSKWNSNGSAAT